MHPENCARIAAWAIADVERREVERAIFYAHTVGEAAAVETGRMVDALRLAELTHDAPEVEVDDESDSPTWRDYAAGLAFAACVVIAWCWACALGGAS